MEVIRSLLVHFAKIVTTKSFKKSLSLLAVEVWLFLEGMIRVHVPADKSIYENMQKNADTRIKPLENTMFSRSAHLIFKEI